MKATVIRSGKHSGGDHFVEVQETPSSPPYAVPVNAELPLGATVEITVKVVEVVPAPDDALVGTEVSTPTKADEESPLTAKEQKAADKEAAHKEKK